MAWHWWLISQNVKNKGSCSWQQLAAEHFCSSPMNGKPWASPFKIPSQCKTCSTVPFLKLIWARWQSGQYSSIEASVFCITAARVLHVSHTSEKTEKANGLLSINIDRRCWRHTKLLYSVRKPRSLTLYGVGEMEWEWIILHPLPLIQEREASTLKI